METKKVGIITYNYVNNYGAVLQTAATQHTFSKFADTFIINYQNVHTTSQLKTLRFDLSAIGLMRMGKDLLRLKSRISAVQGYKKFIKSTQNLTHKIDKKGLRIIGDKYDYLVVGSDQVWNPECQNEEKKFDINYLLDFSKGKTKKFSYASSFGDYVYSFEEVQLLRTHLKEFTHISVRESSSAAYLSSELGLEVETVLDPTLLMDRKEWEHFFEPIKKLEGKNYILVYQLHDAELNKEAVKRARELTDINKVVVIDQNIIKKHQNSLQLRDVSPGQYLYLMAHAKCIITDSFHGCCFSTIFNKPLLAVAPPRRANRLEDFLISINRGAQLIKSRKDLAEVKLTKNSEETLKILEEKKASSINFIKRSLEVKDVESGRD